MSTATSAAPSVHAAPARKRLVVDWASVVLLLTVVGLTLFGLYCVLSNSVSRTALLATGAAWVLWACRGVVNFVRDWNVPKGRLLAMQRVAVVGVIAVVGLIGTVQHPLAGQLFLALIVVGLVYDRLCGVLGVAEIEANLRKERSQHGDVR